MGVAEREDELDTEQQSEEVTEEQVEETETEGDDTEEGGEDTEETVVQIGEEDPPTSEDEKAAERSPVIRDLRKRYRELAQENAKLKAGQTTGQPAQHQAPQLPAKPKLADFDYDEEQFQAAVDGWYAKKREVDAHEANQKAAADARAKAVQQVHEGYAKSKAALKVKDFQDAEDEVIAAFDPVQQSIVMAGAANPGAVVYALGKTPAKLKELASIKDPVKFAVAVGKLETEVKVTTRKGTKPAPETPMRGNGSPSTGKATLERLQAEADKTGDRTKVAAYLRNQRAAGK